MKTQIAGFLGKAAVVTGLAATLAFGGLGKMDAQQAESDNYFDRLSIPAGARTGADANDPYAPVDLGDSGLGALRVAGVDLDGAIATDDAVDPCSPQRCKAW